MPIIALLMPLEEKHIAELSQLASPYDYEVRQYDEVIPTEDLDDVEVLFGWSDAMTQEVIDQMNHLRWVQASSAGTDYFPNSIRHNQDILLSNVSGIHAQCIAQNVIGYLLAEYRGILAFQKYRETKEFVKLDHSLYLQTNHKRMLLYGTGNIASAIARIAQVLEMTVIGINTDGRAVEYFDEIYTMNDSEDIIPTADVVVNTMPLTDSTYHYFNREWFRKMNPQGLFINIGRGKSVNEADLIEALDQDQLRGAYLDVFEVEPLPEESPLWQHEKVIMTPHSSGRAEHYAEAACEIFITNLTQYLEDGTLAMNQYNRDKGY